MIWDLLSIIRFSQPVYTLGSKLRTFQKNIWAFRPKSFQRVDIQYNFFSFLFISYEDIALNAGIIGIYPDAEK
jgi:hypothetical protein